MVDIVGQRPLPGLLSFMGQRDDAEGVIGPPVAVGIANIVQRLPNSSRLPQQITEGARETLGKIATMLGPRLHRHKLLSFEGLIFSHSSINAASNPSSLGNSRSAAGGGGSAGPHDHRERYQTPTAPMENNDGQSYDYHQHHHYYHQPSYSTAATPPHFGNVMTAGLGSGNRRTNGADDSSMTNP